MSSLRIIACLLPLLGLPAFAAAQRPPSPAKATLQVRALVVRSCSIATSGARILVLGFSVGEPNSVRVVAEPSALARPIVVQARRIVIPFLTEAADRSSTATGSARAAIVTIDF
jgi:hypothetical protein